MNEFKLIKENFLPLSQINNQSGVEIGLGIGDDCAIFANNIAISQDVLNEGVHFFAHSSPAQIACKAFASNISDLAAMCAQPIGFLLNLSLPLHIVQNQNWLDTFTDTLKKLATIYHCPLIGGDTTRTYGPLSIGLTVIGKTTEHIPYRHAAKAGDDIWLTGPLGCARLILEYTSGKLHLSPRQLQSAKKAFYQPPSRLKLMQDLAPFIHAAIDLSDGLISDLMHILKASQLSAKLEMNHFEIGKTIREVLLPEEITSLLLNAGDDYEICFTAPATARTDIQEIMEDHGLAPQIIGECWEKSTEQSKIMIGKDGKLLAKEDIKDVFKGFEHF